MDNSFEMYQKSGPLLYASPKSLFIEIVIFYTEILTGKVVLWCFFTSEKSAKIHNSTFLVKISEFVKISFSFERSYHVYIRGCCSKI